MITSSSFFCIFAIAMKNLHSLLFVCCAVILAACSESAGLQIVSPESMGFSSKKLAQADDVIYQSIENKEIPGAVLAVVKDDKIVYLKAYGNKSLVPTVEPMTIETVFDLASVSKCVGTTLSFMQIVENGKVRITDNVKMYIPDFAPWVDPETGEKIDITIRDLLTHSSGLEAYTNANTMVERFGSPCPDSLMRHIATEIKRTFKPGTDFTYSCLNFITLQNILQNVTGEKLCDYAKKNVFDVLGLKHTTYIPTGEILSLCAPTEVQADGKPLLGTVHDPLANICNGGNSGNAGVFSNAEDLAVVCAAIMNGGAINGHRILSPLTVKTMTTVPSENAPHIGRALGWDIYSDYSWHRGDIFDRARTICHTGYTGTELVIDLENKIAVILLTNRVHPQDKNSVSRLRALVSNIVAGAVTE